MIGENHQREQGINEAIEKEVGSQIIKDILGREFFGIRNEKNLDAVKFEKKGDKRKIEYLLAAEDYEKMFGSMDLSFVKPEHERYLTDALNAGNGYDDILEQLDLRMDTLISRLTKLKALTSTEKI